MTQFSTNPFTGLKGMTGDIAKYLPPRGQHDGTIMEASVEYAQNSGNPVLVLRICLDWHIDQGFTTRRVFKRYVFDGPGAEYFINCAQSLDIDLEPVIRTGNTRLLEDMFVGRRVECGIFHQRNGSFTNATVQYCEGNERTKAQERLASMVDEDGVLSEEAQQLLVS